jgi:pimeloyl-ACP methyl ester carboxylesterase
MASVIKSDDIELEYFEYGSGEEVFVLAAGNGRPAVDLLELAEGVAAKGMRVITFNYRGIGASKGPTEGVTLHDYGQDIWRIVDGLGVDKVHLGGKAYGNRVMRAASQANPDRVKSIILYAAGGEVPMAPEVTAMFRRYTDPSIGRDEWITLQAALMFSPVHAHKAGTSADRGMYPEIARLQTIAATATPVEEYIAGGTAPMLVITGLDDVVAVPQNAYNIAESRRNTRLVGIPDCGHNMIFEVPEDLVALTVDHIHRNSNH